jgi:Flp pilus assembly protein TadG
MDLRARHLARRSRRGVAAVELAVLLPLLAFLFVIGTDFARIFYFHLTLTNCARNGALYGSQDPVRAADTAGIQNAALADATNLSPAPLVTSLTGVDSSDGSPYVEVTVRWTFRTITDYPGVPATTELVRTVRMRVAPVTPRNSLSSTTAP